MSHFCPLPFLSFHTLYVNFSLLKPLHIRQKENNATLSSSLLLCIKFKFSLSLSLLSFLSFCPNLHVINFFTLFSLLYLFHPFPLTLPHYLSFLLYHLSKAHSFFSTFLLYLSSYLLTLILQSQCPFF